VLFASHRQLCPPENGGGTKDVAAATKSVSNEFFQKMVMQEGFITARSKLSSAQVPFNVILGIVALFKLIDGLQGIVKVLMCFIIMLSNFF